MFLKKKNKRFTIGIIALILLSSIIVSVIGDEDEPVPLFTKEDCNCAVLGLTISKSNGGEEYLYCTYGEPWPEDKFVTWAEMNIKHKGEIDLEDVWMYSTINVFEWGDGFSMIPPQVLPKVQERLKKSYQRESTFTSLRVMLRTTILPLPVAGIIRVKLI